MTITPEVYAEVVVSGAGRAGASEIAKAGWIEVMALNQPEELLRTRSRFSLGLGELSTILLALELQADLILIDELKARRQAQESGLTCIGCVGFLEEAFGRN